MNDLEVLGELLRRQHVVEVAYKLAEAASSPETKCGPARIGRIENGTMTFSDLCPPPRNQYLPQRK